MSEHSSSLPDIEGPGQSIWRNLSLVWLVPVFALVVALGIAWQAYSDRGTLIEILFENGAGVTAGETTVRYRDVVIGEVEGVHFSDDLRSVVVSARVENAILPFLDEDARFWVVRPEISAQGVSGLSTVVSGVYIEGAWDSVPGEATNSFEGLENPLFVRPGEEGRRITLNVAPDMQLQGGTPLIFRGIEVGRLEEPRLVGDNMTIQVDAFIEAPHDARISSATRFWDSSGFSIDFGADGLSLDVESLASLVSGGIEFDEVYTNGAEVPDGFRFDIYSSEALARASAFVTDVAGEVPVSVQFDTFTRGLRAGLTVEMDGERVGEVASVTVHSFETDTGTERRHVASLLLDPAAFDALPEGAGPEELYEYLADAVENGLRARLSAEGLITSEFRIELAEVPRADPAAFERDAVPFPRIPAVATERPTMNTTAEGVLERVAALPFERLLTQAIDTMASIEDLAADEELRQVPAEAASLLADARDLIGGEDTQAIPGAAFAAVTDLRDILAELRESGSIEALTSVLAQADTAMGPVSEASERLPDLMANLSALSETAAALEIEALVTSASTVLATADTFLSSEELAAVPPALSTALVELETLLTALSEADVVGSLNSTLASTEAAADELPALVEQTELVLAQIGTLSSAYGTRSVFLTEAMDVLREISTAARSIAQLARTIERNPNALLTGR